LVEYLKTRGVKALLLWKHPHPLLKVRDFPAAQRLRDTVVGLPVHQELTRSDLLRIADAVKPVLR
jgi:dTDP-4-amino-4,6-dideoxygalactose transaminase